MSAGYVLGMQQLEVPCTCPHDGCEKSIVITRGADTERQAFVAVDGATGVAVPVVLDLDAVTRIVAFLEGR